MIIQQRFEDFLNQHDAEAWATALTELLPSIHEVDRAATQIWFSFYPLSLLRALQQAEDPARLARQLLLEGKFYLKDQIDSSHYFLYGHRYWPAVKQTVIEYTASTEGAGHLDQHINKIARRAAGKQKAEPALLTGITAVALMTLQQVGGAAFAASPGTVNVNRNYAKKSPESILEERAANDSQGLFGFLRRADKQWTVVYNEADERAQFKVIDGEELASAAARDHSRDWLAADARCVEGPIPVQCRSAACGTCWVGLLGGAERLSDASVRESKKLKEFGYIDTSEPRPVIRLACMAQSAGSVSIVIPPWNGVFGKYVENLNPESAASQPQEIDAEAPVS